MIKTIQLLLLSSLLLFVSCGKDTSTLEEAEIPEDVLYYFTGKVDGKDVELLVTPTNDLISYIIGGGGNLDGICTNDYGGSIVSQFETPPSFSFELLGFYEGVCWDEPTAFPLLFSEGEVPFAESRINSNLKEAIVQWSDENGLYNSYEGEQEGSSFIITKIEQNPELGERYLEIEVSFNCKLYKEDDATQSIQIENGRLRLTLEAAYR